MERFSASTCTLKFVIASKGEIDMRRITLGTSMAVLALALAGCGAGSASSESTSAASESADQSASDIQVEAIDEVVALVPAQLKDAGVLKNGASTDYPPAEFLKDDNVTPTGYEVDMVDAIAKAMGLKEGTTTTETFDALLPKVGTIYDIGASSFSVTEERVKNYDMIAYMDMGSLFATAKGNPNGFDPAKPCGQVVGVQKGTIQDTDVLPALNEACTSAGEKEIQIKQEDNLANVLPKVISGQYAAVIADSPIIEFDVKKSNGTLEVVGDLIDGGPIGVAVSNQNPELTKAVQAAMDALIANGTMKQIFAQYGADGALYEKTELHSVNG